MRSAVGVRREEARLSVVTWELAAGFDHAAWVRERPPLPIPDGMPPNTRVIDGDRYLRHQREGVIGARVAAVGAAAAGLGAVGLAMCFDFAPCLASAGVVGLGGAAFTVGGVMVLHGGIAAARDLGLSGELGWAGVSLVVATVLVTAAAPAAGPVVAVVAIGFGVGQLARNDRVGRKYDLLLVPTGDGLALAGRW